MPVTFFEHELWELVRAVLNKNLRGRILTRADLRKTDLTNCDFRGSDLTNAEVTNINLRGAILTNTDLRGAFGLTPAQRAYAKSRGAIVDD